MTIIDLTHSLSSDMTVFPGTRPPAITQAASIETQGYHEKRITLYSHNGTHIDAPAHILRGAATLDRLPFTSFYGPGMVIDCSSAQNKTIDVSLIADYLPAPPGTAFILLHTGWNRYWKTDAYLRDFPVLSEESARILAASGIKGVGLDTISADHPDSSSLPIHHILLEAGLLIIENLTRLDRIGPSPFTFSCLPLKIADADGSPVRAVAIR